MQALNVARCLPSRSPPTQQQLPGTAGPCSGAVAPCRPAGQPSAACSAGSASTTGGGSGWQQRSRRCVTAQVGLSSSGPSSSIPSSSSSIASSSGSGSGSGGTQRGAAPAAVPAAAVAAGAPYAPATAGARDLDAPAPGFHSIPEALAAMAAGEAVVVLDDEDRENEGDLICAADRVTPELMAFIVRYTSGVVCVGMEGADLDRLRVPLMISSAENEEAMYTAFTVTVDYRHGTSTGISASDRAATMRALADPAAQPQDFKRPGHIFPLRAREGGVLRRPGHTEASVDLCRLAGCRPAGVLCEIVSEDGSMARTPELLAFAQQHGLKCITIADLVRYRLRHDKLVQETAVARQQTRWGPFTLHSYRSLLDGSEHLAAVAGEPSAAGGAVLARVHSESMLGDVFGAQRCDSGSQLDAAMEAMAAEGAGVVVYLRGQQGRGLGLGEELSAYAAADACSAAPAALEDSTFPVDARDYGVAAHILADLGVNAVRLLTSNPDKAACLAAHGIQVQQVALPQPSSAAAHANGARNGAALV